MKNHYEKQLLILKLASSDEISFMGTRTMGHSFIFVFENDLQEESGYTLVRERIKHTALR